ncbi:phenylalanine--tRNA ligase alpha subunit-like [Sycon ciliatum]|uniref:phenylalanine--tRNA ligase alpha subunit-like n=1 Tax=Sycon ciliatum TaxID=27933 RepID=UPI0020ABA53D|eukprot:scpid27869/ scgid15600/ Phenylalanine--tRNA ligase alpha subunit B; Phenylalanyl-tRNA synthetase alpha subunit B
MASADGSEKLSTAILEAVDRRGTVNTLEFAAELGRDHQDVVGSMNSISAVGEILTTEQKQTNQWQLTDEGHSVVENGSHEAAVFNAVPEAGIAQAELMKLGANAKIGFSKAMSGGWIVIDKSDPAAPLVKRKVPTIVDTVQEHLRQVAADKASAVPEKELKDYKKRKLVQFVIVKTYNITKGPCFTKSLVKLETELLPEMIASGSWKTASFKPYNFDAMGSSLDCGHLHPLLKVRAQFRQIFLEMGFSEMPTNNYVESSFWNFDALFQPQQHPARDAHDTFFIKEPATCNNFPDDYLKRVHQVHQEGGYGSQGYGYQWKIEEAQKNLMRTHTTAVSARMLYKLAQQPEFKPAKYFSIDRVFRNESLDATHLAEFHQIEGVVADRNLTLGHLMGILREFFHKLGIRKLRFKPAYNPYTEPSLEVFSYHDGLQKWVEIGNSGIFRPEMLLPMGLPKDVSVIAWGLSLERPTMIKYKINNIRDLVGHKIDLKMVQQAPIYLIDAES